MHKVKCPKFGEAVTEKNLKVLVKSIKNSSKALTANITKIYVAKAWELKGFTSFKQFAAEFFPEHNYDGLLNRARCGKVMLTIGGPSMVGYYSLNSMSPLLKLTKEEQRKVFDSLCHDGQKPAPWLTKEMVMEKLQSVFPEDSEATKASEDSELRKEFTKLIKNVPEGVHFKQHLVEVLADFLPEESLKGACKVIARKAGLTITFIKVGSDSHKTKRKG